MPSFVHPLLLWGLPVVAVPVLIHLINMMRHRRVEWAAMEFLQTSQKKNRTWVLLKQLLLLASRMAAVALVVLAVAQPLLRNPLGGLLRATTTHHIVLLDDSFSMSDRWGDASAFDEAKRVIEWIGAEAGRQVEPQTLTLLRYSQAKRVALGTRPDLLEEPVGADFLVRLRQLLEPLEPSQMAVGPTPALEAIDQLLGESADENRIVYLLSDFRACDWDQPRELRGRLLEMNRAGARVRLVSCVEAARSNLAITSLKPGKGVLAAGVPLFVEVTVSNLGTMPVRDLPVYLETDGRPLPAVKIAEIPAGESVTERFPVNFPAAGGHVVKARLEPDVVDVDNFRYCTVEFAADLPVLLIDGDPAAEDARYVSAALSPGGPVVTGIRPRIETSRYLSLNPLEQFRAVWLFNVERLDRSAVDALERYASGGGGVGVFLGERSRAAFLNDELYRQGKGVFPLPVAGPAQLLVDRLQRAPDLEVTDHPIFRIFSAGRNSFLATVVIERYFAVPEDWRAAADSGTEVIARLRNGAPLVVERRFGEGRVVAVLTTAAPAWNNWARGNPSFVVTMLELQAFLSGDELVDVERLVGAPLDLELDAARYDTAVRFLAPNRESAPAVTVNAVAAEGGRLVASLAETGGSGIYEAVLAPKSGSPEVRRWAVNVDPRESDLAIVTGPGLASRLEGVRYDYEQAGMYQSALGDLAGYNLGQMLLGALVLLLIGEQMLAFSAGYHPKTRLPSKAGGGRP